MDRLLAVSRCTVLLIAHRLSTIRGADRIFVLGEGGSLAEEGTFDELMAIPDGAFANLHADAAV